MADQHPISREDFLQFFSKNLRRNKIALRQRLRAGLNRRGRFAKVTVCFGLRDCHRAKSASEAPASIWGAVAAATWSHSKPAKNEPTPAPPDETRTNRQDCSGSPHLLVKKRHPQSCMRPESSCAFRRHDCTRAPPRCVSRSRPDLTTSRFSSPTPRTVDKSVCSS